MRQRVAALAAIYTGVLIVCGQGIGVQAQPPAAGAAAAAGATSTVTPPAMPASEATPAPTSTAPTPAGPTSLLVQPALPIEPAPDEVLTLDESIRIALQNHGDVGVAQQQFVGAQQRITAARSPFYPQVNITSNYQNLSLTRRTQTGGNVQQTGTVSQANTQTSLVVSQQLFDSGRTRTFVRQSRAGARGAEAGVGVARASIAFEVAAAYFDQLRTEKLLALARQQVEQARQNVNLVQAQVDAGIAARVDAQPVQVELRQQQFNLTAAENNARTATTNFRNALGLQRGPALKLQDVITPLAPAIATPAPVPAPTTPVPTPAVPASASVTPVIGSLGDYLIEAQRQRPDLRQARANVEQAEATRSLAKIEARPQVTVDANYVAGGFNSPLQNQRVLTGGLTIPIFDAGSRRADVREAQASVTANQLREQQLIKDVSADVEESHTSALSAAERITAANALVESARTGIEIATERYRLGLGIALDIVIAQTQLFNAQTSATQAVYDFYLAQSSLGRAVGRWSEGQPTPIVAPVASPAATTPLPDVPR